MSPRGVTKRGFDSLHPLSPARTSRATARQAPLSATRFNATHPKGRKRRAVAQRRRTARQARFRPPRSPRPTQRAKASRRSAAPADHLRYPTMHYVYILESVGVPGHFYIGSTDNLQQRLRQHQADVDAYAAKYRPWKLKTYL